MRTWNDGKRITLRWIWSYPSCGEWDLRWWMTSLTCKHLTWNDIINFSFQQKRKDKSYFIPFSHSQNKSTTKWRWVPTSQFPKRQNGISKKRTQENTGLSTRACSGWSFNPNQRLKCFRSSSWSLKLLVTWNWWRLWNKQNKMLRFRLKLHMWLFNTQLKCLLESLKSVWNVNPCFEACCQKYLSEKYQTKTKNWRGAFKYSWTVSTSDALCC